MNLKFICFITPISIQLSSANTLLIAIAACVLYVWSSQSIWPTTPSNAIASARTSEIQCLYHIQMRIDIAEVIYHYISSNLQLRYSMHRENNIDSIFKLINGYTRIQTYDLLRQGVSNHSSLDLTHMTEQQHANQSCLFHFQWIDHGYWYDKKDSTKLELLDVFLLTAMCPPGTTFNHQ